MDNVIGEIVTETAEATDEKVFKEIDSREGRNSKPRLKRVKQILYCNNQKK